MLITVEMASGKRYTRDADRIRFFDGKAKFAEVIRDAAAAGKIDGMLVVNAAHVAAIRLAKPEEIEYAKSHGEA